MLLSDLSKLFTLAFVMVEILRDGTAHDHPWVKPENFTINGFEQGLRISTAMQAMHLMDRRIESKARYNLQHSKFHPINY